jgi:tetratricopeptide (TPR) repeat protein
MQTPNTNKLISQNIIARADQLYQHGQCDPAVDLLVAAIKKYAGEKSLYFTLVRILIDSDQFMDAMAILDKMPSDEGDLKRLEFSGYCKFRLGHYEEALAIADRILCAWKESSPALNLKGVLAYKQADKKTANHTQTWVPSAGKMGSI